MTKYLILDGYNLIGAVARYATRFTGGLDASRELLINDTLKVAGWMAREAIIVFDASQSPEPERTELRADGVVCVIYSAPKESADDVIERLSGTLDGSSFTVYTADFALQLTALARGGVRATPREFEKLIAEFPSFAWTPDTPFRARVSDRLPPEVLRSLEEVRRRTEGR